VLHLFFAISCLLPYTVLLHHTYKIQIFTKFNNNPHLTLLRNSKSIMLFPPDCFMAVLTRML